MPKNYRNKITKSFISGECMHLTAITMTGNDNNNNNDDDNNNNNNNNTKRTHLIIILS